jgi:hypothetical protein
VRPGTRAHELVRRESALTFASASNASCVAAGPRRGPAPPRARRRARAGCRGRGRKLRHAERRAVAQEPGRERQPEHERERRERGGGPGGRRQRAREHEPGQHGERDELGDRARQRGQAEREARRGERRKAIAPGDQERRAEHEQEDEQDLAQEQVRVQHEERIERVECAGGEPRGRAEPARGEAQEQRAGQRVEQRLEQEDGPRARAQERIARGDERGIGGRADRVRRAARLGRELAGLEPRGRDLVVTERVALQQHAGLDVRIPRPLGEEEREARGERQCEDDAEGAAGRQGGTVQARAISALMPASAMRRTASAMRSSVSHSATRT